MRFEPGWYEKIMDKIRSKPETVWLGSCLGLDANNMDISKHRGAYNGATLNFYGVDKNLPLDKQKNDFYRQVLEGKWHDHKDDEEVACLMGATYFVPKKLFFDLGGLQHLRKWGSDEPYLSLKIWLSGHEIRMARNVRIGHKFRLNAPYETLPWEITWNKLWVLMTVLGEEPATDVMLEHIRSVTPKPIWTRIVEETVQQMPLIVETRKKYRGLFKHDLRWFCDKFKIPYPEFA